MDCLIFRLNKTGFNSIILLLGFSVGERDIGTSCNAIILKILNSVNDCFYYRTGTSYAF